MCYDLNVCVPPKFICGNLIPKVMVFRGGALGRCLGPKGGALLNGISALINESPQSSLPLLPSEATEKTDTYEPKPDAHQTLTLLMILESPASRTMRNKSLLFISPQFMVFCYSSINRPRHSVSWNSRLQRVLCTE